MQTAHGVFLYYQSQGKARAEPLEDDTNARTTARMTPTLAQGLKLKVCNFKFLQGPAAGWYGKSAPLMDLGNRAVRSDNRQRTSDFPNRPLEREEAANPHGRARARRSRRVCDDLHDEQSQGEELRVPFQVTRPTSIASCADGAECQLMHNALYINLPDHVVTLPDSQSDSSSRNAAPSPKADDGSPGRLTSGGKFRMSGESEVSFSMDLLPCARSTDSPGFYKISVSSSPK